MKLKTLIVSSAGAIALAACGSASDAPAETSDAETTSAEAELHPMLAEVAAGTYSLEKNHAFMTVKVGHNGGITQYRISFTDYDGNLD